MLPHKRTFTTFLLLLLRVTLVNAQDDFITFDECGVDTAAEKGIIKSPNYPTSPEEKTKYPNDLNCVWTVDMNDRNTLFMVKFMDLVTQHRVKPNNETICQDYVNITTESTGTEQYCGFTKPEDLYRGVGPKLTILFYSDARYAYRGFMMVYQGVPDHDPCRDDPCVNGECEIMADRVMYECICESGFTGYNCQADIDECASDPCKNGATCEQTEKPGYECYCDEGWQGVHCEIVRNPDPCLSNPCRNGGSCTASDDNEEFFCTCTPGYTGITCRRNIDECSSDPCENGGTCEDKVNEYECACKKLYYGLHCENKQKINGCRDGPCSENGDCVSLDDEGGFMCECLPGWTGTLCEADLEECLSNPCQNDGICDDTASINRFDCTCIRGYTGKYCEIEFFKDASTAVSETTERVRMTTRSYKDLLTPGRTSTAVAAPASTTSPSHLSTTGKVAADEGSGYAPPMCQNPGIPYLEEGTQWEEGATLRFYCIEGYTLKGPENLTCLKNESWSMVMPECVADKNGTTTEQKAAISPWLGTMIVLSSMLAVTLVAFVTWIMLKGPWNFGPNVTRIMSISQVSLASYDPNKEC